MPETNAQLSLGSVQYILATVVAKSQECEIQVWFHDESLLSGVCLGSHGGSPI